LKTQYIFRCLFCSWRSKTQVSTGESWSSSK